MKKITVTVPEKTVEGLKIAYEASKKMLRPEVLKRLKWDDFDVFKGDLLRYGIVKVQQEEGIEFIEVIRNERDPLFVEHDDEPVRFFQDGVDMFR